MKSLIVVENPTERAVMELKLDLDYLDARGNRLGSWTTIHSTGGPLVPPMTTNQCELQAFFVPQFTRAVSTVAANDKVRADDRAPSSSLNEGSLNPMEKVLTG